jgi:DNA-binding CsgD family transcriptional regulator
MQLPPSDVTCASLEGREGWEVAAMSEHVRLTDAERNIALALLAGLTRKEIAARRRGRVRTVDWHFGRMYAKTATRGQAQFALWASEHQDCCLRDEGPP